MSDSSKGATALSKLLQYTKDNDMSVGFNSTRIDYQALAGVTEFIEMNNRGHVSDVVLSVTVPAGQASVTVPHGLIQQPGALANSSSNTLAYVIPVNGEAQTKNWVAGISQGNLQLFVSPAPATPAIYNVRMHRYKI